MKSKKTIDELEAMTDSVMRWGSGEEVIAHLDWDSKRYYLWFEPTDNFLDWAEENPDIAYMVDELNAELEQIGVQEFCDLDGVNAFCKRYCGDEDPAMFYIDEVFDDVRGA